MGVLLLFLSAGPAAASSRPVLWARGSSVYVPADGLEAGDLLRLEDEYGRPLGRAEVRRVGPEVAVAERLEGPRPGRGWRAIRTGRSTARPRPPMPPPAASTPARPARPAPAPQTQTAVVVRPLPPVGPFEARWRFSGLPGGARAIGAEGGDLVILGETAAWRLDLAADRPALEAYAGTAAPAGREVRADLDGDGLEEVWRAAGALVVLRRDGERWVEAGRSGPIEGEAVGLALGARAGRPALLLGRRTAAGLEVDVLVVRPARPGP